MFGGPAVVGRAGRVAVGGAGQGLGVAAQAPGECAGGGDAAGDGHRPPAVEIGDHGGQQIRRERERVRVAGSAADLAGDRRVVVGRDLAAQNRISPGADAPPIGVGAFD
ncbi:hypothetical protein GCM10009539_19570 [Cryptosporangium japonicum]|uniref:Uncharacterized protein n=1 Tax=Cryptosporangium japonicum TaxID=80872 RepID=A0ABN0TZS1_9ACTN